MNHFSTLGQDVAPIGPEVALPGLETAELSTPVEELRELLRFPGDDGGQSLAEIAVRDLEVALQLLAERAQYITGAAGAAIALLQGDQMVCRASAGPSAPQVGALLEVSSGLSGESVRTRKVLCCDNAESDPRVDREICEALGIVSAMVMPLFHQEQVVGVFELLSTKVRAFQERDLIALQRLGEMIQTAVEHAEAAKRVQSEIKQEASPIRLAEVKVKLGDVAEAADEDQVMPASSLAADGLGSELTERVERGNIGRCTSCGFPVSEGRALCLDCEPNRGPRRDRANASPVEGALGIDDEPERNWLQSNKYLIGTLIVAVTTMVWLLWFR